MSVVSQLGRFSVQAELGRGAMGVVYRGLHPGLEVPVALKVLSETYSRDESFRARFQREAAMIASLNHPGIVRVYDFDSDQGSLFIVMEYVEGRTLRAWLAEYGRFTVEVAADLAQQLLSAVGAAHAKGIVHRDLKPDNVLISTQGKTKILDFGISKVLDDARQLTATGSMVGTPSYMSPEQVKGDEIDARADIYAVGVMLYELIHGEPPYTGSMASVLHSHVYETPRPSTAIPQPMMEVIWKAMAKDRSQRYQSCEQFSGALIEVMRPAPVAPPAEAPPPSVQPGAGGGFKLRLPRLPLPGGSPQAHPTGACAHGHCGATEGWQCAYTDATGEQCQGWLCKKHITFLDASPFCPRHSTVIRALQATAGTIREIKHRPRVADRALTLAAVVCEDVNRDLTELLRRRYQGRKDLRISIDGAMRQTWEGRGEIAWERSWSAVQNQGYLARVGVRVAAAAPDVVKVTLGNQVILEEIPEWISKRQGEGEPIDNGERGRLRNRIVEAVLEHIDTPVLRPGASQPPISETAGASTRIAAVGLPELSRPLAEGMLLRLLGTATRMTGYELADQLALPHQAIEPALKALAAGSFLEVLGLDSAPASHSRGLQERMAYSITHQGRARSDEIGSVGTRYLGPAPVSIDEYRASVAAVSAPISLAGELVRQTLDGLEVPPGVAESVRAAVNSRGSLFLYGAPGNGKTSLARRMVALLGGPMMVPVALELGGEVVRIFDPSVHQLEGEPPADRRWRRVSRPLVQVGGEFDLSMFEPTWEPGSRTYQAPLQLKANGGVLLIDDLGRQRVSPKQVLDRLMVPLEQATDYLNLASSGRKAEVPFKALLALSTNLKPADLLDEAYLRRLSYKVHMPDPSWEAWCRIFETERLRLGLASEPQALEMIRHLYGGRPMRGNHPRDLLERLVDVASARGVTASLTPDLVQAAWRTLFVSS